MDVVLFTKLFRGCELEEIATAATDLGVDSIDPAGVPGGAGGTGADSRGSAFPGGERAAGADGHD
jgi:H2-forming N5,N10-methylenetetrahydromethanopterin dehydrogenase-like enzyme